MQQEPQQQYPQNNKNPDKHLVHLRTLENDIVKLNYY